ncbi:MAG TPA: DUF1425 domain-containing protein [Helicobacteraceae bacterium]|nr:DUF1425 domain-containing protein [Helicobacteraceae bacterium]
MKSVTVAFFALLLIFGCADKMSVKVVDNSIEGDIKVLSVNERIQEGGDLKEIQLHGENQTDAYIKLRYRVEWKDKDGFSVESLQSSWRELPVYKNADFNIRLIAPSPKAVKYMIFINK